MQLVILVTVVVHYFQIPTHPFLEPCRWRNATQEPEELSEDEADLSPATPVATPAPKIGATQVIFQPCPPGDVL